MPWRNLKRFFCKFFKQPFYAVFVALKRLSAYLAYSFQNGKSSLPEAITIFLTHRCNLHCKMCGQWGEGGVTRHMASKELKNELTFAELKKIIDEVSSFKPNITLFGGEPLLHPSCVELIEYIKGKKMHCLMITNGYLLAEKARGLIEAGLDELNVSLDGAQELHDQIRGMPGLFKKITDGIRIINKIKGEKKTEKPLINLQCTITEYNYKHLEQLLDMAKELKVNSLTFHNLIFLEKETMGKQKSFDESLGCSSMNWEGFVFEPNIDPRALYAKSREILKKGYSFSPFLKRNQEGLSSRISIDFYPNLSINGLKDYYQNRQYMPNEYPCRCLSPWIVAYIFPDGEVRPCLNFSYSYGNMKENNFVSLWNNGKAVFYRRMLKKNKIFPVCVRCTELYRY